MSKDIIEFSAFVLETYRFNAKLSGPEVDALFTKYNVYDYIADNFDVLHSFGEKRIIWEIKEYIKNQKLLLHNK